MSISLALTLIAIGIIGALLSGMLGIGGAIVNYPMLLYIPTAFGVASYSPHEVAGIVAVQVLFATLSGVIALRKHKMIHPQLVVYMGSAILVGSFVGGYGAKFLSGDAVNIVYAVLATIAAIMMLIPQGRKAATETSLEDVSFNRTIAVISALIVGIAAGIVGAGGAFILVPVMLQVLRIPIRITIGSSLAITFVSSIGASAGKVMAGHIPYLAAGIVVLSSIVAAPIGVRLGRKVKAKVLRVILAILVVATTIKIWSGILF